MKPDDGPINQHHDLYEAALRTGATRSSRLVYRFCALLVRGLVHPYFSVRCHGVGNLNIKGPLIIAPTHRSNLDVPLLAPFSKRHIRSLAKDSMFKGRLSAWFSAAIGAVPVRREAADRQAIRTARQLLQQGEAVLLFPEGTRQKGVEVAPIFDGCAWLSAQCDAGVVPVGIAGTEEAMPPGVKIPRRKKVVICVGEPLHFDLHAGDKHPQRVSLQARREFSAQLKAKMQELSNQAHKLLAESSHKKSK